MVETRLGNGQRLLGQRRLLGCFTGVIRVIFHARNGTPSVRLGVLVSVKSVRRGDQLYDARHPMMGDNDRDGPERY